MQILKVFDSEQKSLVGQCVAVLRQGIDLIENLDDVLFTRCETPEKASVGTHFRHNLDFVTNLLKGLESGKLDYNLREIDLQIETNRQYAISRFSVTVSALENLTSEKLERQILVRSETIESLWCESSAMRELEFLQSHTIHHYALIVAKLSAYGFSVPKDFGVAPSTLEFWKSQTA
ncbi:MAG: hypothetical protein ABJA66_15030 [Actinomycetota bacterium]